MKSWRRKGGRHFFVFWWQLCSAGCFCAHTEKVVTDLFPSWWLGQAPTVCSLWRWYKNFYLKPTQGFDIAFPCQLFWCELFQSSAQQFSAAWKILPRASIFFEIFPLIPQLWQPVDTACGSMCWGYLGCRGPTPPGSWVFAALIPRTAAFVLSVTHSRAARALLWMHRRWNSPIMFPLNIFLVNVFQLLLNHVCTQ